MRADGAAQPPLLSVVNLAKSFGGVRAVAGVSFGVAAGEILGLIGPNGAGKTTTFNLVSGRYRPSGGEVVLDGRRIDGMRPDRVAALGVARTFQGTRTFPRLSAAENVRTALLARERVGFWEDWLGLARARAAAAEASARTEELLSSVGIAELSGHVASSLPYAHQSRLGIALALAVKPRLLLLDEPFAGMNPRETMEAADMVRRIRGTGVTVLLVEHDMAAVMSVCDRIVVLQNGAKIAEGAPAEIRRDSRVIEAYLGTDDDA